MPEGLSQGQKVEMDALLNDYYAVMGWDQNGVPTPLKLQELELTIY